jgi:hypothetical protein
MPKDLELQRDDQGNIVVKPLAGFNVAPIAGTSVFLLVLYADSLEELQREDYKGIQFVLTPPHALQLAEALARLAPQLMQARKPDEPLQ